MSSIHEREGAWFGIARRLPDGTVVTPQAPGIVTRISPTPEEIHAEALKHEALATNSVLARLANEGNPDMVFPKKKKE